MAQILIAKNFSLAAKRYDQHSKVQRYIADQLANLIAKEPPPTGNILEIGAGTGHLTKQLVELFPEYQTMVTDISSSMIKQCQKNLGNRENLIYQQIDGELVEGEYAMIASSMTYQWFANPKQILHRHLKLLKKGGALFISFPDYRSYPELEKYGLMNPMINPDELFRGTNYQMQRVELVSEYATPLHFFKELKLIGAQTSMVSSKMSRLKTLINDSNLLNNGPFKVTSSITLGMCRCI